MKATSIIVILIGVAITIFCITFFKPALDVVDSETMTIGGSSAAKTSEWPIFAGILTTFVGVCFFIVASTKKVSAK